MAENKRIKTKYPGVFYREAARIGGTGIEKVYYIIFKKDGTLFEEKAGRQFADAMTPAKAAGIRAERIEGKRLSPKEIRKAALTTQETIHSTLLFLWEKYKEQNKDKASIKADGYRFKNHIKYLSNKTPNELFTSDILQLTTRLNRLKLSPQTVKHVIGQIRRLIRFGAKNGFCSVPPPEQLHFDIPKVDNLKTETLTNEQLIALKKALDEEVDQNAAAFMRLALATGMRSSALMNLRWDDIDFVRGFITLRGEVAKKGKTEIIPLTESARSILLAVDRNQNIYVFPGKDGGPRRAFRRVAQRVKEKAGLPKDFRPLHGLRHAYASFLASSGQVDLYTLQRLLTHSSPQMTQRYAHLSDNALKKAAGIVDKILTQKGE